MSPPQTQGIEGGGAIHIEKSETPPVGPVVSASSGTSRESNTIVSYSELPVPVISLSIITKVSVRFRSLKLPKDRHGCSSFCFIF